MRASTERQLPPNMGLDCRTLSGEELDQVSGGMKWDRNHVSSNVIDARGGQMSFFGFNWAFDINGKVSSVEPA